MQNLEEYINQRLFQVIKPQSADQIEHRQIDNENENMRLGIGTMTMNIIRFLNICF